MHEPGIEANMLTNEASASGAQMHELRIEAKSLANEAFGSANLISSDSDN